MAYTIISITSSDLLSTVCGSVYCWCGRKGHQNCPVNVNLSVHVTSCLQKLVHKSVWRLNKLKVKGNNESFFPLWPDSREPNYRCQQCVCVCVAKWGVVLSNEPFIVHVASQQESTTLHQLPPLSLSYSPLSLIQCGSVRTTSRPGMSQNVFGVYEIMLIIWEVFIILKHKLKGDRLLLFC